MAVSWSNNYAENPGVGCHRMVTPRGRIRRDKIVMGIGNCAARMANGVLAIALEAMRPSRTTEGAT